VLIVAAVVVALFPRLPKATLVPGLMIYGFFFMANYPIVEAALMESVPDAVRGRVFGFFITIGGLVGNLSHWIVGNWVQHLGFRGGSPAGYYGLYLILGGLILVSLLGWPCLHAIRKREQLGASGAHPNPQSAGALATPNPEL
jgi:MFS family permease